MKVQRGFSVKIKVTEKESNAKPKVVALAMPERLRASIKKEAYENDISFSAMVRRILEEHYSKQSEAQEGR